MPYRFRGCKGFTLIELLVAMAISAILIAAIYRTFIGQHRTYTVQEDVVDMQQNVRVAINRMMREIRMAGFGNVRNVLPFTNLSGKELKYIIYPVDNQNNVGKGDDQITIIGAFEQISTLNVSTDGTNTIELVGGANQFIGNNKKYLCVGGLETHIVTGIIGNTITLDSNLLFNHRAGTPVFKVKAIRYRLRWDNRNPNMPVLTREDLTDGGGSQVVAENIENLQFRYVLEDNPESEFDSPAEADWAKIRLVNVKVYARTRIPTIEIRKEAKLIKEEYRRRTIASNIYVRNMGLSP